MLLKSSNRPKDYSEDAEPTSMYKVRQAQARLERLRSEGKLAIARLAPGDTISKGLDAEALRRRYNPSKETGIRYLMGVYRVPIGISAEQLHQMDKEKVTLWIEVMAKQGWDWVRGSDIEAGNGVYPAKGLDTNTPDLGSRERIIRTKFRKRDIEIVMTELRPEILNDLVVGEK